MTLIHATPIFPTIEQLTINIAAAYQIDTPSSNEVTGVVCMFDEIKVKELLDWCPATNSVIGLCREHSGQSPPIFNNIDDVHVMFNDLVKGRVHVRTEVCLT